MIKLNANCDYFLHLQAGTNIVCPILTFLIATLIGIALHTRIRGQGNSEIKDCFYDKAWSKMKVRVTKSGQLLNFWRSGEANSTLLKLCGYRTVIEPNL